jgi:hypothetical protein
LIGPGKMSDKKIMSTLRLETRVYCCVLTLLLALMACSLAIWNNTLAGTGVIPYDEGSTEEIPSAAARLCNIHCGRVSSGCAYTFDIEVFETCWKPVYAVEIYGLLDGFAEAVSWPENWKAATVPSGALLAASMVFYTNDSPIMPGSVMSGFGLVSYTGSVSLRWFPADEDGILMGKTSRLDLSCPTGTEPSSWGTIKSIYR